MLKSQHFADFFLHMDVLSRNIVIHDISTFNTSMYLVKILSSMIFRHIVNPFTNPPVPWMVAREGLHMDVLRRDITIHDISTFNTSMYLVEILSSMISRHSIRPCISRLIHSIDSREEAFLKPFGIIRNIIYNVDYPTINVVKATKTSQFRKKYRLYAYLSMSLFFTPPDLSRLNKFSGYSYVYEIKGKIKKAQYWPVTCSLYSGFHSTFGGNF